ncbi:MAG: hypothetical protein Q9168_005306 [Polycauliona sp. 1 TL-2023]
MALYADGLSINSTNREFRILVLLPGEPADDLHGEVRKASIDDAETQYTALSYTWGDPSNPGSIVLNQGHTLPITRNLEAALQQFRLPTESITLWIDAICINQADHEEKNLQVALMRDIYVSARQTWVWLGASSTDSDHAMDTVQAFHTLPPTLAELQQVNPETWNGIGKLMRRSWWTRVWVIQEVLSSTHVSIWCGTKQISFACFVKLEEIRRDYAFRNIPTQSFANILSNWSLNLQIVRGGNAPLFEWMADTHKFDATLRRDRIYALLGLSSQESRDAIIPDYSNRTSDTLLSTRATAHFLIQQRRLLPLQSGFYKKADNLDLPSWVSDWSTSQAGYVTLSFESPFRACGQYDRMTPRFQPQFEHVSSCPENASIILKGVVDGEIDIAFPMLEVPLYFGDDTEADLRSRMLRREVTRSTVSSWKEVYDQHPSDGTSVNTEPHNVAFWRTVIADRLLDGSGPPSLVYGRYFEEWQAGFDSDGVTEFRNAAVSHCAGRSFIRCSDGRLGLGPRTAKSGDLIVLLHGGDVPFVLRPLDGGRFAFVGEAYVHGIMQGEHAGGLGSQSLRDFEIV